MSKRHNILPTGTSFSISSEGKIESVQELTVKLFQKLLMKLCSACAKQNEAVKTAGDTCSLLEK